MFKCLSASTHVQTSAYAHTYTHTHKCACTHTHTLAHTHTHTYTHVHIHAHARSFKHKHTHYMRIIGSVIIKDNNYDMLMYVAVLGTGNTYTSTILNHYNVSTEMHTAQVKPDHYSIIHSLPKTLKKNKY